MGKIGGGMSKRMLIVVYGVMLLILWRASSSFASGFNLPDQSASALGMAGAFVGQADDPSAVWYNPAGMTQFDGARISAGAMIVYPVFTHENTDGTTDVAERVTHAVPHLFFTDQLNDRLSFGIGVTSPFGLSINWSPTSETRYVSTFSSLNAFNINPNAAYKITDDLSMAIGVDYFRIFHTTLEKISSVAGVDETARLSGDGDGWGANLALLYRVSEAASIGLSYRSRIKTDIHGTASINGPALSAAGSVNTSITLPDMLQAGVSHRISDSLTLNEEIDYTWWSTYDKLSVSSDNALFNQTLEQQWRNSWAFRVGGQYKLDEQWKLRAGYFYDQTPVQQERFTTSIPDSNHQGVTAGAGYTTGRTTVDGAYKYARYNTRTVTNSQADDATPNPNALNGVYKTESHEALITVSYKF
jgi:long-chain fatty acid transport protein